jgi:serine/threonine protein kinase
LPPDAPEGLCPQCLLRGVIGSVHDAARPSPDKVTTPYVGPPASAVEDLAPLFPQLEIIELIGQGGMGAVYKARQPSLDRLVAVKVLPPEAGRDPAFAERFGREARALARLSHPNIVAVHDVGRAGDFFYFVMEFVDGVNLRQLLRDGQLDPAQALRIVPQICDALQYAHEEGVVHRDIKPENILLDRKGRVKIADFGLAKLLGRDGENFTLTGSRQVMGTLYYMAPEQVERPLEVDHRADIYSLGVVFYEMLTGQLPVGRFPMPSEKAGTEAYLDGIVLRALEREPERRYQHASDVKTDVEADGRWSSSVAEQRGRPTGQLQTQGAVARVLGPSKALLVSGISYSVFALLAGPIAAITYLDMDSPKYETFWRMMASPAWIIVFWVGLAMLVQGPIIILGALKMRHLESYWLALAGSIVALVPASPLAFFGVPISVWALSVLMAPEVRAAFRKHSPSRGVLDH